MPPHDDAIRELAARAWREALEEKSREFADDVARRMGSALVDEDAQSASRSRELRDGTLQIAACKSQGDAMESLLAACVKITPACGLLMVRGAQASGWSCVGLTSAENFKRASLDCSRGVVAAVLHSRTARTARAADLLEPAFTSLLRLDPAAELLLLPLLVKERAAALLLARSGSADDLAALEVLVQVAQLTLDLQAYGKSAAAAEAQQRSAAEPAGGREIAASATMQTATNVAAQSGPAASTNSMEQPARPAAAVAPLQPELRELHERGRRFAKLLVEEIKLYNQAKVSEGRAKGDLYLRLRDEIEKSRAAYQKRYGESVKGVDYFTQELMRILADNDPRLMGAGFPG